MNKDAKYGMRDLMEYNGRYILDKRFGLIRAQAFTELDNCLKITVSRAVVESGAGMCWA